MARRKYAFVIMIWDRWWKEFCLRQDSGKLMHSYVQKGLAPPKAVETLFFYVTKPVGKISGCADFVERRTGKPEPLWEAYGHESAIRSRKEFQEFIRDKQEVSFIRLRNLRPAICPIPLNKVLLLLGKKRLSRKGFYVDAETATKLRMQMGLEH